MNIDDLIQLLNNRLRDFKLSRDYAKMNGDLARMNDADKEVIALEDTLYKLNLLADTSKSAAVKETTLTQAITDGSVAVLSEYDITPYATDPLHEEKIMTILSNMGVMDTVEKIDAYVKGRYASSPVTGEMIMNAANAYAVDTRLMMALMELDSRFGTAGVAVKTLNPGNVGNDDAGNTRTYDSWQAGVTAVAEWLNRHRGSTITAVTPAEPVLGSDATSTPATMTPTATLTPITTTSTTTTVTTSTSTPQTTIPVTGSTPSTSSGLAGSPQAATSTPATATTTPATDNVTSILDAVLEPTATSSPLNATSTLATASTTPMIATSTPTIATLLPTATTTPVTADSTPAIATSTSTTATDTSTSTSTPQATTAN